MDRNSSYHGFCHSFCVRPRLRFDSQSDDETIMLVLRAHPITQIPVLFNGLIILFLLFLLDFLLPSFISWLQILFINVFIISVIFSYWWYNFLNWYFNVGIITNKQIVDVDFDLIVTKEITYTLLNHVEDVTSKGRGYFSTFFDYGNIYVQTAGNEINTEFLDVPYPSRVVKIINDLLKIHR